MAFYLAVQVVANRDERRFANRNAKLSAAAAITGLDRERLLAPALGALLLALYAAAAAAAGAIATLRRDVP